MLNGRCILPIVTDVVATVADGIATFVGMFNCGRAGGITTVADGIATGSMYNCYFNLGSVMLLRTSSHM